MSDDRLNQLRQGYAPDAYTNLRHWLVRWPGR